VDGPGRHYPTRPLRAATLFTPKSPTVGYYEQRQAALTSRKVPDQPTPAITVAALYERECTRLGYQRDPVQERVVAHLDDLRQRLLAPEPKSLFKGLLSRKEHQLQKARPG
jgi:predicted ATPase